MKRSLICMFFLLIFSGLAFAKSHCFIAKEHQKTVMEEGDCQTRFTPQSTFKVALSLMGYDSGLLESETEPEWPYKKGYVAFPNVCQSSHNPRTWMRDSCLWYSQVLTERLGMKKFSEYVVKFDYGNRDVSGGLTTAWISSSLRISPEEQVAFLTKLTDNTLPVTPKALNITKKLMYREELPGGWALYGKTGSARNEQDIQHGWFVGWIEKDGRIIPFADHISDDTPQSSFASFRAREQAKEKLWSLIEAMEPQKPSS